MENISESNPTKVKNLNNNNEIKNISQSEDLSQTEALGILINAIYVGQQRGAWKLDETEVLLKAIRAFSNK